MKLKHLKKVNILFVSLAMMIATICGYNLNIANAETENSHETIKMPITIYDHLNDGLLFEYPLDGGGSIRTIR